MSFDLLQPVFQRLESLSIVDSVGHDDAHRSLIVCLSYCFEALLAGRVPYLHANLLAVHLNGFDLEVDA